MHALRRPSLVIPSSTSRDLTEAGEPTTEEVHREVPATDMTHAHTELTGRAVFLVCADAHLDSPCSPCLRCELSVLPLLA